jgi:hypothetical protein
MSVDSGMAMQEKGYHSGQHLRGTEGGSRIYVTNLVADEKLRATVNIGSASLYAGKEMCESTCLLRWKNQYLGNII